MFKQLKLRYIFWLARHLPDCDQTTRMVSDAMERDLSLKQKLLVRLHLHVCEACKQYRKQIQLLHRAFQPSTSKELQDEALPPASLSSEAKERIKRSVSPK